MMLFFLHNVSADNEVDSIQSQYYAKVDSIVADMENPTYLSRNTSYQPLQPHETKKNFYMTPGEKPHTYATTEPTLGNCEVTTAVTASNETKKRVYMTLDKPHTYATMEEGTSLLTMTSNNSAAKTTASSSNVKMMGQEYASLYETPIDGVGITDSFVIMRAETNTEYQEPIDSITCGYPKSLADREDLSGSMVPLTQSTFSIN